MTTTEQIVKYLTEKGKMSGRDITADLDVDELDIEAAAHSGAIVCVRPAPGGPGSWYAVAGRTLTERLAIRLTPETRAALQAKAVRQDRKPSYLVRLWILERLRGAE